MPTTLWEYPSQHYDEWVDLDGRVHASKFKGRSGALAMQGDQGYVGATPSWVVWQVLMRYSKPGDLVVDPMCGSGTTLDVCADLDRRGVGFDLAPTRPDITRNDARRLPLPTASVDLAFIDPPYSTHVHYSDDPACIGTLDAGGDDDGQAYYQSMDRVLSELHRVLKPNAVLALYVSDSFRKRKGKPGGTFMPIGLDLFDMLRQRMRPLDMIAVVRHNEKLTRGNWRKAAVEENFFLRGFNYLMLFAKHDAPHHSGANPPTHAPTRAAPVRPKPAKGGTRPPRRDW
jgi:DNA modification methylase